MLNYQVHFIALGGNMPSRQGSSAKTVRAGISRLAELVDGSITLSPLYRTPCFPPGAGPDYVNAAAAVHFAGGPRDLLDLLHQVEAEFGRNRVQRWGQRTLDIDLIASGDTVLPDPDTHAEWRALPLSDQVERTPDQLILPHPRLQDRAFVLVPLADIASDWVHPLLGQSVHEMLAELPADQRAEVKPI